MPMIPGQKRRTFEDNQEQTEVAEREERLFPDVLEDACERRAIDDTDGNLAKETGIQAARRSRGKGSVRSSLRFRGRYYSLSVHKVARDVGQVEERREDEYRLEVWLLVRDVACRHSS